MSRELQIVGRYAGLELSAATEDGRPALAVPDDPAALRDLYVAHLERTHVAIRPGATPLTYEAWLDTIPYALTQRAIRRALRAMLRASSPLGPASIVMSDAKTKLARPHVFGLDVLLRWPVPPDVGHGRDHNIEINRSSLVVCIHARGDEGGFAYESVRFLCSHAVRDALGGRMRATWEASYRRSIEVALVAPEPAEVARICRDLLAHLIRDAYLPTLAGP